MLAGKETMRIPALDFGGPRYFALQSQACRGLELALTREIGLNPLG